MDFNFMAFGMIYCPSKKYQYVEEVDLIQHMAPSTVGGGRIRVQHTTALHGAVLAACYWKEEH